MEKMKFPYLIIYLFKKSCKSLAYRAFFVIMIFVEYMNGSPIGGDAMVLVAIPHKT